MLIALVSVLGLAATAGTTGATVMLTLTLSTLGLPLAGVGLLLAIEPIIDMGRTATNVAGQTVVAAIVAKREGILTAGSTTPPQRRRPVRRGDDLLAAGRRSLGPARRRRGPRPRRGRLRTPGHRPDSAAAHGSGRASQA